jgi:hypothetical protein
MFFTARDDITVLGSRLRCAENQRVASKGEACACNDSWIGSPKGQRAQRDAGGAEPLWLHFLKENAVTNFNLEIQIDQQGVQQLQASGQQIGIVKETNPSQLPVVWAGFPPQAVSNVSWDDEYSVYASQTQIQPGAILQILSTARAQGGEIYPFNNGFFQPGQPGLPSNEYGVRNEDQGLPQLSAGLAQTAGGSAGGRLSPTGVAPALFQNVTPFTPSEILQVFASPQARSGEILQSVPPQALRVDFSSQSNQTIHFNDATGTFQPGPLG